MTNSMWIAGLLPLIAFAIADVFFGLKTGLIAAFVLAIIEAGWTWMSFGELDQISLLSILLIVILGLLAWKKNSAVLFKLQPSIISLFLGGWLIFSWFNEDPLFVAMAHKYRELLPEQMVMALEHPFYLAFLARATLTTGLGLLLHALVTAWAAVKLNTWWWIAIRGVGFYGFCFLGMLLAKIDFS